MYNRCTIVVQSTTNRRKLSKNYAQINEKLFFNQLTISKILNFDCLTN